MKNIIEVVTNKVQPESLFAYTEKTVIINGEEVCGLLCEDSLVVDYDGCFDLSKEIKDFLIEKGYDLSCLE